MKLLVLDAGGSSIKYSFIDDKQNREAKGSVPAPLDSVESFVKTVGDIYAQYKGEVDGVAMSMPGFVNGDTGYMRTAGAYMPMYGTNMYDLLKDVVDVPVSVENDGKCAALAEAWMGNLKGVQEGAVVIIGTGLAGGIIHEGKIFRGFSGVAGEYSFISLPVSLNLGESPLTKCSMAAVTVKATAELGIDINKNPYAVFGAMMGVTNNPDGFSELNDDPRFAHGVDGKIFFELLEEGNEKIAKIYDDFLNAVAGILMTVQCTTDPEYIVLGGGVTAQPRFLRDVQAKAAAYNSFLGGAVPQIQVIGSGADNCPNEFGAAYAFLQKYGK